MAKRVLSDEARRDWRDLLNEVEYTGEHVTVVRYRTPAAVLVPLGWYERAVACLEREEAPTQ